MVLYSVLHICDLIYFSPKLFEVIGVVLLTLYYGWEMARDTSQVFQPNRFQLENNLAASCQPLTFPALVGISALVQKGWSGQGSRASTALFSSCTSSKFSSIVIFIWNSSLVLIIKSNPLYVLSGHPAPSLCSIYQTFSSVYLWVNLIVF